MLDEVNIVCFFFCLFYLHVKWDWHFLHSTSSLLLFGASSVLIVLLYTISFHLSFVFPYPFSNFLLSFLYNLRLFNPLGRVQTIVTYFPVYSRLTDQLWLILWCTHFLPCCHSSHILNSYFCHIYLFLDSV